MRRVACYSATSIVGARESIHESLQSLIGDITTWLEAKGVPGYPEKKIEVTLASNRKASVWAEKVQLGDESVDELVLEESSANQRFLTRICLGVLTGQLQLFLELRAGGDGALVAPVRLDVRCPQILRAFLDRRSWSAGHTPVRTKPVEWHGSEAARKLLAVIAHAERNLPVVVVSQRNGRTLEASLTTDLARDVSGLALVADVDDAASWAMTKLRGKEWSCYNGAIRVYWPLRGKWGHPSRQPVWTWDRLMAQAGTEDKAASRIRDQLRRRLLELSTYTFDEPRGFFDLRDRAARARFEALQAAAAETGSHSQLAEQFFEESVRVSKDNEALREENARLRDQVSSLSLALQFKPELEEDEIAPDPEEQSDTLARAVARAKADFEGDLRFGDDVDEGVNGLASDAGPPDKIYDQLKILAEMTEIRRKNSLGKNMLDWLKSRGIRASSESESVHNSASEMAKRTWRVNGQSRRFEMHLKPTDGTSPDRCVRIYFDYDSGEGRTIVGWVGRHPS